MHVCHKTVYDSRFGTTWMGQMCVIIALWQLFWNIRSYSEVWVTMPVVIVTKERVTVDLGRYVCHKVCEIVERHPKLTKKYHQFVTNDSYFVTIDFMTFPNVNHTWRSSLVTLRPIYIRVHSTTFGHTHIRIIWCVMIGTSAPHN